MFSILHKMLLFFLLGTPLMAAITLPPQISLRVPPESAVEGREVTLYITIVYDPKNAIDETSFQLNKQPIHVERVQTEKVAPQELFGGDVEEGVVLSRFKVQLPQTSAGLYTVGPVTVRVGGIVYTSGTVTVNVQGAVVSDELRLESSVLGPPNIYPGQRVVFEYKILYSRPLQLFREDLPLLAVRGFRNTGSPEIVDSTEGSYSVQTIRQTAIAETAGRFDVSTSLIEGMDVEDGQGSKRVVPPLRRATTSPLSIVVLPFPKIDCPSFFTGALGSFVWRVFPPKSQTIPVGEPMRIEYRVSGRGEMDTVQFPAFERLVGLKDSFWTDTTPPVGEVVEGTKLFVLIVRPKRVGELEVPGFSFASFDPDSQKYITKTVQPISLTVAGLADGEVTTPEKEMIAGTLLQPPFELDEKSVVAPRLSAWWILFTLLGALGGGFCEMVAARKLRNQKKIVSSKELFYKAVINRSNRQKGLTLLEQAFYLRLFEVGLTAEMVDTPQEVPADGLSGEVRGLLEAIEKEKFLKSQTSNRQDIFDTASLLYHRLKELQRVSQ